MAKLSIKPEQAELSCGRSYAIVSLIGSLDISNVVEFEDTINDFIEQGVNLVCLDFVKLDYINSTGLGLLVKISDNLAEADGQLHLHGVSENIVMLFDMLGLSDVFNLYSSRGDAIDAFDELLDGVVSVFPLEVQCDLCSAILNFPSAGKYRCPSCNEYFDILGSGEVTTLTSTRLRYAELKLPLHLKFIEGMQSIAKGLSDAVDIGEEVGALIEKIIDEFCSFLLGRFSEKKGSLPLLHAMIIIDTHEVRINFRSRTEWIKDLDTEMKSSMSLKIIRTMVDDIDIVAIPTGGQLISIWKKIVD